MQAENTRIAKLREYLINVINTLSHNQKYQINANWLSNDINNYSLDKVPTDYEIEKWIIGPIIKRDVYSFRSRMGYYEETLENLATMGFFEEFENIIKENNKNGILPDIEGIESIEYLNPATIVDADTKTAEFDIELQITYREE